MKDRDPVSISDPSTNKPTDLSVNTSEREPMSIREEILRDYGNEYEERILRWGRAWDENDPNWEMPPVTIADMDRKKIQERKRLE